MSLNPRLLWLVNTKKGLMVLKEIMHSARECAGLISSYSDRNVSEDYGALIAEYCRDHRLDYIPWSILRKTFKEQLVSRGLTGIVAIGWQYLIPRDVYYDLPHRLVVFHDSLLPKYRGFAPVATAMIKGETEFGVSVLYATDNVDDGDIIHQARIHIGPETYLAEAIEQIGQLYCEAALKLCRHIRAGTITAQPQDHTRATYSLWRSAEDCAIDWGKPAPEIYNLIRAVSHPYPGAFSMLDGARVRIWRSEIVSDDPHFEIRDPGKIWRLENGHPVVVCGQALLRITDLTSDDRKSLLPMSRLRLRFR